MAVMDEGVWYILQESTGVPTADSLQSLPHLSGGKSVWRQAVELPAQYFCDYMRQFGILPDCSVCGSHVQFEGHVQSQNHFKNLWRKLELEPRHEPLASMRGKYWQEIQVRRPEGFYTVRFNHADFEMQICRGQPPPPQAVLPPHTPLVFAHVSAAPPVPPSQPCPIFPGPPPVVEPLSVIPYAPTPVSVAASSGAPPPPPPIDRYRGELNANPPPPPPPSPPSSIGSPTEMRRVPTPPTAMQSSGYLPSAPSAPAPPFTPMADHQWSSAIATTCTSPPVVLPPEVEPLPPQPTVRFVDQVFDSGGQSLPPTLDPPVARLHPGLPVKAGPPMRPNLDGHAAQRNSVLQDDVRRFCTEAVPAANEVTLRSEAEVFVAVEEVRQEVLREFQDGGCSGCVLRWVVDRPVVEIAQPRVPGTSGVVDSAASHIPPPHIRQSPMVPMSSTPPVPAPVERRVRPAETEDF